MNDQAEKTLTGKGHTEPAPTTLHFDGWLVYSPTNPGGHSYLVLGDGGAPAPQHPQARGSHLIPAGHEVVRVHVTVDLDGTDDDAGA